ncbi:MAG: hypothetical protein MZV49_09435 [Rhodopseudomonas palustris]|nr:hypothetical protein [Rhodopseudomonas palustris]
MKKRFEVVGRGVGAGDRLLARSPTWNTYPGLFAALATGNAGDRQAAPGERAAGGDQRAHRPRRAARSRPRPEPRHAGGGRPAPRRRSSSPTRPARGVDRLHRRLAPSAAGCSTTRAGKQVYAELAGVNNVVIESTDNYKGMLRNLAFTLSLYSGQMCTTTQGACWCRPTASTPTQGRKSLRRGRRRPRRRDRASSSPTRRPPPRCSARSSRRTTLRADRGGAAGWPTVVLASKQTRAPGVPARRRSARRSLLKADAAQRGRVHAGALRPDQHRGRGARRRRRRWPRCPSASCASTAR